MYTTFNPFQKIDKQDFSFSPTHYNIWNQGKIILSGTTIFQINAKVIEIENSKKVQISFLDKNINDEISDEIIFDEFITQSDRMQLITIPEETIPENLAINALKLTIGSTRKFKNFKKNEPFCCNLFLIEELISKISFCFSNPEKLIEFYAIDNFFLQNVKDELMRNISTKYQINNNSININDVIEEAKFFITVNLLITKRNTGNYNNYLIEQYFLCVESFLNETFKEFSLENINKIKKETLLLLNNTNNKTLINQHYNELYGDDGINVI